MSELLQVNTIDTPPEWGIVGVIVGIAGLLIATFLWWVRAARIDLRTTQRAFIDHLQVTGAQQTTALVAATETLHTVTAALERIDRQQAANHVEVAHRLEKIEREVTVVRR